MNATAAILVGGQARRLEGRPKPLLRIGGGTILDRQLDALRAAGCDDILLTGRWPHDPVPGVTHVPDVVTGSALAGLYSSLLFATRPLVLVIGGDLPFLSADLVRRLASPDGDEEAIVPETNGRRHPLCAGYRRGVAPRVQQRLHRNDLRVADALADFRVRTIDATAHAVELTNVNTLDDLRRAEEHASTGA